MSEWQPIETAPKDGTLVLGFRGRSTSGVSGAYARVTRFNGYEWVTIPGTYSWAPSHWMPLPDPPKDDALRGHSRSSEVGSE